MLVDVAFATQKRGEGGNQAEGGREVESSVQTQKERRCDQIGEETVPQQIGLVRGWQCMQHVRRQQICHRVVAQEGGEKRGSRRQVRDSIGDGRWYTGGAESIVQRTWQGPCP